MCEPSCAIFSPNWKVADGTAVLSYWSTKETRMVDGLPAMAFSRPSPVRVVLLSSGELEVRVRVRGEPRTSSLLMSTWVVKTPEYLGMGGRRGGG